jgi:hypothetical protein
MILCSAYLDDGLRDEAEGIGINISLSKERFNELPTAIRKARGSRSLVAVGALIDHENLDPHVGVDVVGAHESHDLALHLPLDQGDQVLAHRLLEPVPHLKHTPPSPISASFFSPFVRVSPNRIMTLSRLIVVRALVGPLPVYSWRRWTASFDIAAAVLPVALDSKSDMHPSSLPPRSGSHTKEEGSGDPTGGC